MLSKPVLTNILISLGVAAVIIIPGIYLSNHSSSPIVNSPTSTPSNSPTPSPIVNSPTSTPSNSPTPSPIVNSPTSTPNNPNTTSLVDTQQKQLEQQQKLLAQQQQILEQQQQEKLRLEQQLKSAKNQPEILTKLSSNHIPSRGMWVIKVESNSEADLAGIKPGQLLISLNNVYIDSVSTANQIVSQNINQPVTALLWDHGNQVTLTVTPKDNLIGVLLCQQDRCINGRSN